MKTEEAKKLPSIHDFFYKDYSPNNSEGGLEWEVVPTPYNRPRSFYQTRVNGVAIAKIDDVYRLNYALIHSHEEPGTSNIKKPALADKMFLDTEPLWNEETRRYDLWVLVVEFDTLDKAVLFANSLGRGKEREVEER